MSNHENSEDVAMEDKVEAAIVAAESTTASPPAVVVKNTWVAIGPGEVEEPLEKVVEGGEGETGVAEVVRQSSEAVIDDVVTGDDGCDAVVAAIVEAIVAEEAGTLSIREVVAVPDEQVLAALAAVGPRVRRHQLR
jgi:hypothetical protein